MTARTVLKVIFALSTSKASYTYTNDLQELKEIEITTDPSTFPTA